MKIKVIIILALVLCCSCSEQIIIESDELQEAISQVWLDADQAQKALGKINTSFLSEYELQRYRLTEAHLMLKRELRLPSGSDMDALAKYFESCGDEASVAEAYYIQGAYLNWLSKNTQAMQYLKKAEIHSATAIIRGMTYYKMGRISESEQLYDIALENYQKALPYLEEAGLPLYLASVYRELGRNTNNESRNQYFDKALTAAQLMGDSILQMDIRYAQLSVSQPYSPEIASICQYMCHEVGRKRYAYDLVKYYIRTQKADSAKIYLDILATDTTAQIWSAQQHALWESQYLHLKGKNKEAYEALYNLYNAYYRELEESGKASAFVAAQHFDNEVEKAKNLQLQLEKQQLYILLGTIVIVMLCVGILLILYSAKRRTERLTEQARAQQQISNLQNELQLRRDALKRVLNQRLELNKNLQEALLTKKKEEKIPDWAQQFIDSNIFSTEAQWGNFFNEFKACYGNLLNQLQKNYPRLTNTDIQVIALYILGLDNADICLLLGLTQRTIWSRRMRIKDRVGLGEKESLDLWIEEVKGDK
jgi:DNA-binding CsgD family transcriptional regulator/cbb3-type cytochrome oxidase subunit 3